MPIDRKPPRLIRHNDKARVTRLVEGGKVRGYQIEAKDGRVAAVVRPDTAKAKVSIGGRE